MSRERLYIFDTTLRDGAQTQGVDFSVEDKRTIALALDRMGVDYVEGGWPGANPTDTAFFAAPPKLPRAKLIAFGMTKRPGRSAANDPGLAPVLDARAQGTCLVGKAWDFHVTLALGITLEENIELIHDSIAAAVAKGGEAMYDAEHFFDGYKANPDYALACLKAAEKAGARWIVLCDTNGGALPHEVERIVGEVAKAIPGDRLGIHAHNDTENAVANSLVAVRAGVRQVQGTLNGLGERCGNANLVSLIPTLMLKPGFKERFEIGISDDGLAHITQASRLLDELLNRAPNRHAAYVGASAFAHKGGLHVSAVEKDPRTYEHVPPESVGNQRHILVSDQAGRSNILARLREAGIELDPKHPKVTRLLEEVKEREFQGYSYDGAEASFELMARRALGQVPDYFDVRSFRVMVERRHNAYGELVTVSEATVKVSVDGEALMSVGEGNGPVNALDNALRKDLGKYSSYLADLRLVDFKVRILTGGTEAVTRVLIESADAQGNRWFTVGVSPNIVDASFQALYDSIVYKLHRDGAPAASVPAGARSITRAGG
ncbi:MAG TPA: citramalate synthase [Candidatus Cybelea sp.]|nr:citramalate synthase [Candidatus Cybelea sp.]